MAFSICHKNMKYHQTISTVLHVSSKKYVEGIWHKTNALRAIDNPGADNKSAVVTP